MNLADDVLEWMGFDLRVIDGAPFWDEPRRRRYLLRADVAFPASVDPLVWPSLFHDPVQVGGMDGGYRQRMGLLGIPLPQWIGPHPPFWDSYPQMVAHGGDVDAILIAVYRVRGAWSGMPRLSRAPVSPDSALRPEFMGFDVADEGFISALADCAPREEGTRWRERLNGYHLFDRLADANDFAAEADRAIPEHAPFSVFGLWRLVAPSVGVRSSR